MSDQVGQDQSNALIRMGANGELLFNSIAEVKSWILTQQNRYELQLQLRDWIVHHRDQTESHLVEIYDWIKQDRSWEERGLTEEESTNHLQLASEAAKEINNRTIKELADNIRRVEHKCTGLRGKELVAQVHGWRATSRHGKTFFAQLATFLSKVDDIRYAVDLLNTQVRLRLENPKRGSNARTEITSTDLTRALAAIRNKTKSKIALRSDIYRPDNLKKWGMTINSAGIFSPLPNGTEPAQEPIFADEEPRQSLAAAPMEP